MMEGSGSRSASVQRIRINFFACRWKDPDPGVPKTYEFYRSGSGTLLQYLFNTILELVYFLMILLESTEDEILLKITKSKFLLCAFTFRVKSNGFN
jgi:hypothetical protein